MASDYEAMSHESEGLCWCGTNHGSETDVERIAEVVAAHSSSWLEHDEMDNYFTCLCGKQEVREEEFDEDALTSWLTTHQAEQLAAAGFGHIPTALHQAAEELELPGTNATGYYAGYEESGYQVAEMHAEEWLRARADRAGGDHV